MSALEIREPEEPGGPVELEGHAATTGTKYAVGNYVEELLPGRFRRSLAERPDVSLLVGHEGLPLARTVSETLQLDEDERGLHFVASLDADDPDVKGVVGKIRRGDLSEKSFAFRTSQNGQQWSDDGSLRQISALSIHRGDISLVGYGANPATSVTVRAEALTAEQRKRRIERVGERVGGGVPVRSPRRSPKPASRLERIKQKRARVLQASPVPASTRPASLAETRRRARALERRREQLGAEAKS